MLFAAAGNATGEESDFDKLLKRNAEMVYKLAFARCGNEADADDIFQQVFLRYLTRKPNFASDEHEKAWFIRATINRSKSLWDSAFRRHTQPLEEAPLADPTNPFEAHESRADLAAALAQLPADYRTLINLFYYEDLSTSQIAQLLKRREGTVRQQLTRARRQLQEIMKGDAEYFDL